MEKDTRSEKGIIAHHAVGSHSEYTQYPLGPDSEVCKMTETTKAGCKIKLTKRVEEVTFFTNFGHLITADHQILNVQNELGSGHRNALMVHCANWIQRYPMKSQDTSDTVSCLKSILLTS